MDIQRYKTAVAKSKHSTHIGEVREDAKLYLFNDDTQGFGITEDSELVNMFSNKGRGIIPLLMAVEHGARHLNCFDGFLTKFYSQVGFKEYDRVVFDIALAPDGWDYNLYGTPDVVYMRMEVA
ncbi:hypothetical protein LCGC14_1985030 [marine sediment metagenome]|uniref:YitH acetyltransferase (GNAT) domain-containing protein n=1 Tax=marine sediment metagenome TaxID=412755 RepID=A0A0F9F810_9ZZZZ